MMFHGGEAGANMDIFVVFSKHGGNPLRLTTFSVGDLITIFSGRLIIELTSHLFK